MKGHPAGRRRAGCPVLLDVIERAPGGHGRGVCDRCRSDRAPAGDGRHRRQVRRAASGIDDSRQRAPPV